MNLRTVPELSMISTAGTTLCRRSRNEPLADDGAQRRRHLTTNLVTFVRGEKVESTTNGGVRGGRVQSGQHEMAGVRGGEGGHERLAVAHFADDDDIGILAHDRERERVRKLSVSRPTSRCSMTDCCRRTYTRSGLRE